MDACDSQGDARTSDSSACSIYGAAGTPAAARLGAAARGGTRWGRDVRHGGGASGLARQKGPATLCTTLNHLCRMRITSHTTALLAASQAEHPLGRGTAWVDASAALTVQHSKKPRHPTATRAPHCKGWCTGPAAGDTPRPCSPPDVPRVGCGIALGCGLRRRHATPLAACARSTDTKHGASPAPVQEAAGALPRAYSTAHCSGKHLPPTADLRRHQEVPWQQTSRGAHCLTAGVSAGPRASAALRAACPEAKALARTVPWNPHRKRWRVSMPRAHCVNNHHGLPPT